MYARRKHRAFSRRARERARLRASFHPASPETLLAEVEAVLTEVEMIHQDNETTIKALRRLETQLMRRAS